VADDLLLGAVLGGQPEDVRGALDGLGVAVCGPVDDAPALHLGPAGAGELAAHDRGRHQRRAGGGEVRGHRALRLRRDLGDDGALADDDQVAGGQGAPGQGRAGRRRGGRLGARQRGVIAVALGRVLLHRVDQLVEGLRADDHALAALGAALGEIDGELVVAEGDPVVRRHELADVERVAAAVGVDHQVAAVGEADGELAVIVEDVEPRAHDRQVGVGEAAPALLDHAVHEVAEDLLGVGGADRLEDALVVGGQLADEAAGVAHHPVAAAPGPGEGLGVGVAVGAPGRVADVQHEQRRLEVLPGPGQLAADRALRRRRFFQYDGRRLAAGVIAEPPAIGQLVARGQAAQIERGGQLALERHGEEVGHRAQPSKCRPPPHGAPRLAFGRMQA
jgi:hypothetical protein